MTKTTLLKSLLCCAALFFSLEAKLQIITTVAGNGTIHGYSGDGGLALNAAIDPDDIDFDSLHNMYVAQGYTNVVRKIDAITGIITTVAGTGTKGYSGDGGPATQAQLNYPASTAVDSLGNIYISDYLNYRVRRVDVKTGIITTVAGNGIRGALGDNGLAVNAELDGPFGIALNATANTLYILTDQDNRLRKVDLLTGIITTIAGKGDAGYSGDGGLAVDALLNEPAGLAIDRNNNIYISDFANYRVREITASDGKIHLVAGNGVAAHTEDSGLATNVSIGYVYHLALDANNNLYLPDWGWSYVRKLNLADSTIKIVAGNGGYGYNGDGVLATKAIADQPYAVAIDAKGNFYFAEFYGRIRKVTIDSSALNEVFGYAYYDLNSNNIKDSSESFFTKGKIIIKNSTDSTATVSSDGNFRIGVDTGNYVTSFAPFKNYYTAVPSSHTSNFSGYSNIDTVNFAMQSIASKTDVVISMYSLLPPIPGFDNTYIIRYQNAGTDTISTGEIQLVKDSKYNFVSSSPNYTSIDGDTIKWNYNNFEPLDTASITVQLALPSNVNLGDTIHLTATIKPVKKDLYPADDTTSITQITVGSFDPNSKSENHGGSVSKTEVVNGDYLIYTIRFQNTGTYAAYNIVVKDTLSSKLNWNSFEMVDANHNYQLTITDGNKCAWYFNGIGLPDSNSNEPASHGYIVYRIKLKKNLVAGDVINNSAGIYFDYNLPIQTNTEKTIVQNIVLPLQLLSFTAQRNGTANLLKWSTANEINTDHFEIERSNNSRNFSVINFVQSIDNSKFQSDYQYTDAQPIKAVNYYRLKMVDKDGRYTYSSIQSINNIGSFDVTLYPNPVKSNLVLNFSSEREINLQMQIVNTEGKTILSKKTQIAQGESKQIINVAPFSAGNYFVKIISSEEELSLKFVKQ